MIHNQWGAARETESKLNWENTMEGEHRHTTWVSQMSLWLCIPTCGFNRSTRRQAICPDPWIPSTSSSSNFLCLIEDTHDAHVTFLSLSLSINSELNNNRYNKCMSCYNHLLSVRAFILKRQTLQGKLGRCFREMSILMQNLEWDETQDIKGRSETRDSFLWSFMSSDTP